MVALTPAGDLLPGHDARADRRAVARELYRSVLGRRKGGVAFADRLRRTTRRVSGAYGHKGLAASVRSGFASA